MTVAGAAEWLGVGEHTIRTLIRDGILATVPHLPASRIAVAELERFVSAGVQSVDDQEVEA